MFRRPSLTRSRVLQVAAILLCTISLSLAGCVQSTPTPEPITISFAHANHDTEHYRQLVARFNEAYPHITVDLRPKRWDMLGGLGAGDADVFVTSQFALSWLYEQGNALNLTPFLEQDDSFNPDDFYPGTLGLYNREGKAWGIPAGVDIMVMYYNQDLLDQSNVPYPQAGWNWNDFLTTAMSVRDPTTDAFGYVPTLDVFDVLTVIYQHGGSIFDDLQNPTRTTFDDPLTIEALDWYADLFYGHNVAPTTEQVQQSFGRGDPRAGILLGQVGMWSGMLSERGGQTWETEWDMRWGAVPLPRDQQSTTLTLVEGYFISAQSQHPDACWQWISFLSKQLPSRQTPARRSLAESADYSQRVGSDVAAVAQSSMENALLLSPKLVEFEEALALFTQAFESVMRDVSTPEEAMNWAQQQSKFK